MRGDGVFAYRSGNVVIVQINREGFIQAAWKETTLAAGLPAPPIDIEAPCSMQGSAATDTIVKVTVEGNLVFRTNSKSVTESNLWMRALVTYVAS